MGRLSTIKPRKLEKAILKCGFIYEEVVVLPKSV